MASTDALLEPERPEQLNQLAETRVGVSPSRKDLQQEIFNRRHKPSRVILAQMAGSVTRCGWVESDPLMVAYHDEEWGVPLHGDRALFELLTLEGAQAGLSWATILKRREGYRRAFDGFDIERIANYGEADVARLLADEGIIRNRAKVAATIRNARAALEMERAGETLDFFLWQFVGGEPTRNGFRALTEIPAESSESKAMSKALKQRGFGFVGPTICYAFMQSAGMINDHVVDCFRYAEV